MGNPDFDFKIRILDFTIEHTEHRTHEQKSLFNKDFVEQREIQNPDFKLKAQANTRVHNTHLSLERDRSTYNLSARTCGCGVSGFGRRAGSRGVALGSLARRVLGLGGRGHGAVLVDHAREPL